MENKEIWPCMFAGNCACACHPGIVITASPECYMTTDLGLRVRGDCDCKVLDDGTIAISYHCDVNKLKSVIDVVLNQKEEVTFRQIHYICTDEQPGPSTSKWPLIWTGRVQCDGKTLTFDFVAKEIDPDD